MAKKQFDHVNRIRVVLVEKGLTGTDLAEMIQMAPQTINRICRNEAQPNLTLLKKMALALDVDIRELLVPTK